MLQIIDEHNRHLFSDALQDMHQMRYRAAVQEMGWHIEADKLGRDIDEFDYHDTVYVLYFNPDGSVGACGRLNPTMRPHLLSEVFPKQCIDGVPVDDNIWHYSRYLVERAGKTQREYMLAWMLVTQAVNEWCISKNVEKVTWLARKRLYAMSVGLWSTEPLGPSIYYPDDDKRYIAAISKMNREGLRKVSRYTKTPSPVAKYMRAETMPQYKLGMAV